MNTINVVYAYSRHEVHLVKAGADMKPLTLVALCGRKQSSRARGGPWRVDVVPAYMRTCAKCAAQKEAST